MKDAIDSNVLCRLNAYFGRFSNDNRLSGRDLSDVFLFIIFSFDAGVDWELEIYPKNEEEHSAIAKKIRTEFEPNPA